MIAVVWQFEIRPEQQTAFEELHGADGEWTALARRSRSYLGSSFLRDLSQESRYLLTEYWSEMVIYENHQAEFRERIAGLRRRRDRLVESSVPLGVFQALDVPDRTGPAWSTRRSSARGESN